MSVLIHNIEKNEINLAAVITVTKDIYGGYNCDSKFVFTGIRTDNLPVDSSWYMMPCRWYVGANVSKEPASASEVGNLG